jgi:hypothetical protein
MCASALTKYTNPAGLFVGKVNGVIVVYFALEPGVDLADYEDNLALVRSWRCCSSAA